MPKRFLISSIVIVASAVLAQAALASGEPKNQSPFNRQIAVRTVQSTVLAQPTVATGGLGEAKNELPFTRQVAVVPVDTSDVVSRYLAGHQALSRVQAEAKNELPFTRQVAVVPNDTSDVVSRYLARRQAPAIASSSGGGFDWTLAIGIAAALTAIGTGLTLRLRRTLQHKVPQTA
ncbi:MAG TPA: hypothetical protein VNR59_05155 [Gaiellaceae bacterium]|nr:hypothetical protein [Gaiellaceae bacterium]